METLALGPKNSNVDKFDANDILAELDELYTANTINSTKTLLTSL